MDLFSAETWDLLQKKAVSIVLLHDRERVLFHILPSPQEDERFQIHFGSASFEQVRCPQKVMTIKQLSELVQPRDWFTTINLKDAYCHVDVALKNRKFLCFAFQGVAYEYNRLLLG